MNMRPDASSITDDQLDQLYADLADAQGRLAAVRTLAERSGIYVDGARRILANQVLAALDSTTEQPTN